MKYVFVLLLILNTQCVCVCVAMVHSYLSKKISFQFSDSLSLEKKPLWGECYFHAFWFVADYTFVSNVLIYALVLKAS